MRFVLASGNRHKLKEFRGILAPDAVLPMSDDVRLPPEGSSSFEENAAGKALTVADRLNAAYPADKGVARIVGGPPDYVLGDDSGLEVEALGWAPGVVSSRYAGPEATDADNNRRLLRELDAAAALAPELRRARFVCVLVAVAPSRGREGDAAGPIVARGEWWGTIAAAPSGDGGFGYDPLFVPDGDTRSAAELPAAEKDRRSHRALAGRELLRLLGRPEHATRPDEAPDP